jgi:acyl-coenzyme A thioesterase PaaI-like protein
MVRVSARAGKRADAAAPVGRAVVGDVNLAAYHGGVIATFMQVAALTATYVLHGEDRPPKLVVLYRLPALAGPLDLFARCEMHRVGKRVAAVGNRCWQHGLDAPVARGRVHVFVAPSSSDSVMMM